MKVWLFLIWFILSSSQVNSNSCSDKLDKLYKLDRFEWCNGSTFNINSYTNICKRIRNCNLTYHDDVCEYITTIQSCKINTIILYIFLLGILIVCCYLMIVIVYNLLDIINYSKTLPLLFFVSPIIMLLAVNEQLYIMAIFISIASYLLVVMGIVWYKQVYL